MKNKIQNKPRFKYLKDYGFVEIKVIKTDSELLDDLKFSGKTFEEWCLMYGLTETQGRRIYNNEYL